MTQKHVINQQHQVERKQTCSWVIELAVTSWNWE